jgi:Ca2+-binding EF-hand superfamily protein
MINAVSGSGSYPYIQTSQRSDPTQSLFDQIDANKDNSLDQSELKTFAGTMSQKTGSSMSVYDILSKLDTNGDGQLSREEFDAGRPEGHRHHGKGGAQALMDMLDNQGNNNSSSNLDPLDTNGDGIVDAQELAAAGLNMLTQNYMSMVDGMFGNQEQNQGLVDFSA